METLNELSLLHSWRTIAEMEPYKSADINHAKLRRYANGDEIIDVSHRKAMGMRYTIPTECCPSCKDGVHTYDCKHQVVIPKPQKASVANKDRGKRKRSLRPPSTEIRKDDAAFAAGQIGRNCHFKVEDLIVELSKQLSEETVKELKERL